MTVTGVLIALVVVAAVFAVYLPLFVTRRATL